MRSREEVQKLLKFVLDDGTGVDRVILSGIHEYYEPEELVGKTCIAITNLPPRAMMGIDSCGMLISAVHSENGEEKLHLRWSILTFRRRKALLRRCKDVPFYQIDRMYFI